MLLPRSMSTGTRKAISTLRTFTPTAVGSDMIPAVETSTTPLIILGSMGASPIAGARYPDKCGVFGCPRTHFSRFIVATVMNGAHFGWDRSPSEDLQGHG